MSWRSEFVDVDGISTHYLSAGDGRPVVLLHAGEFGGAAELSWEHTIPALAGRYRVIAPDWLGFGRTAKLHDFESGQTRRLEHMRRLLEVLGIGAAAFVGNSMGGLLLARAVARTEPLWEASALAIVSAGGYSPDNDARRTLVEFDGSREAMRDILKVLFRDPKFHLDEDYLDRRWQMSALPGAWECSAASRFRSPQTPPRSDFGVPDSTEWELISAPTLLVAGDDDPLKEHNYTAGIAKRLSESRTVIFPHCGHAPNIEAAADFNRELLAFLDDVYPAA